MTMQELEGKRVKISAGTITVKDADGKTRGMVKGIRTRERLNAGERLDFFAKAKAAGVWQAGYANRVILDGDKFYFLNDTRPLQAFEKLAEMLGDCELVRDERRCYDKLSAVAEQAAQYMTVINCEILTA